MGIELVFTREPWLLRYWLNTSPVGLEPQNVRGSKLHKFMFNLHKKLWEELQEILKLSKVLWYLSGTKAQQTLHDKTI